jgi:hypothetical protein
MNYKNSGWAHELLELQRPDGSWGDFHTLSITSDQKHYTETALRRLRILGFTIEDEPIQRAIKLMHNCLNGHAFEYGRPEKVTHDFNMFNGIMYSAWIRLFTMEDDLANKVAGKWADVITHSFDSGTYDNNNYIKSYTKMFGLKPHGGRLTDFSCFYQVALLAGALDKEIEESFFRYIITYEKGIYYITSHAITELPPFEGCSQYLYAIELLCRYKNPNCLAMLTFVKDWLIRNRGTDGMWDMGKKAKDMVYFPLSDDWRTDEKRKADCTYMVSRILKQLDQ